MKDQKLCETLLLKEFDQRFQEKTLHMQRYHRQTDFLQLFVGVAIALGGISISPSMNPAESIRTILPPEASEQVFFMFILLAVFVAEYLLFSILDSWVIVFRNAHRLAAIELELNEMCGHTALRWDSVIAPEFYIAPRRTDAFMRFDYLSSAAMALILALTAISLIFLSSFIAPKYFWEIVITIIIACGLNVYQCSRLTGDFLPALQRRTFYLSNTSGGRDLRKAQNGQAKSRQKDSRWIES